MQKPKLILLAVSIAAFTATHTPAAPATQPSEQLVPNDQSNKSIMADVESAEDELMPLFDHGRAFGDDAKRAEIAPKALPLLHRVLDGFDKLNVHAIRTTHGADEKYQTLALLAWFGDEKTLAQLKENSTSKDDTTAVEAVCAMGLGDWWKSAHDEAGQTKVLATMKALAHAHEKDDVITRSLMMMANTTPASPALRESAMALIADDLKGPLAARVATMVAAERKLKAMEGKPLVIAGLSLDGKNFTTADWKGKVILVDFWASWCGPCKAELPRVEKAYADFHGKGLEVLGVSCDQGVGPLNIYLQQNPEMKWPQLFDPAKPGWHELAKGFGINGIPTMFLIDKAGILRSVTARQDFETEIPKMLEEKVAEKSNG